MISKPGIKLVSCPGITSVALDEDPVSFLGTVVVDMIDAQHPNRAESTTGTKPTAVGVKCSKFLFVDCLSPLLILKLSAILTLDFPKPGLTATSAASSCERIEAQLFINSLRMAFSARFAHAAIVTGFPEAAARTKSSFKSLCVFASFCCHVIFLPYKSICEIFI